MLLSNIATSPSVSLSLSPVSHAAAVAACVGAVAAGAGAAVAAEAFVVVRVVAGVLRATAVSVESRREFGTSDHAPVVAVFDRVNS